LNAFPDSAQLAIRTTPTGDLVQEIRRFTIKVREALPQEFANNQRIQNGSVILGCRYQCPPPGISAQSIDLAGEFGFVGARTL
jgi:hypothetical protein